MPLRWKLRPGDRRDRSSMFFRPCASSFSWLKAMTLTGTSCRRSSRRVAVTTISSRPPLGAVSASPVAAMAGHASWPTKAVDHKSSLIVSERIAHPFLCCLSPTSRTRYYLVLLAIRCASKPVSALSLILLLTAVQQYLLVIKPGVDGFHGYTHVSAETSERPTSG